MAYIDLNFLEYQKKFSSEESCLQAIFETRWPRGFICPKCGHNDGDRLTGRRSIQCCVCDAQTSITAHTLFHRTKIPLPIWFLIMFEMAHDKGGANVLRLSKRFGMHYSTVWSIVRKIRIAMGERDKNLTLAGYIEMDEAFFGGRNKKPGPKSPADNKKQVLVLVESEGSKAGNLVMQVIESSQYYNLKPIIEQKIESEPGGQWIKADGWGAHHVVIGCGHQLKMKPVPKSLQDKVFPCLSLAISHAKRFFKGTYHHFCKINIQEYLDEFCYRWNRRHLEKQLASHLIAACSLHPEVLYSSFRHTAA